MPADRIGAHNSHNICGMAFMLQISHDDCLGGYDVSLATIWPKLLNKYLKSGGTNQVWLRLALGRGA